MALQTGHWHISKEDWEKALSMPMPSLRDDLYSKIAAAERNYVEEGVRRALSLWVSELEPELMYRQMETRPFGVTAKGHGTPYISIKWDANFYLTGASRSSRLPLTTRLPSLYGADDRTSRMR